MNRDYLRRYLLLILVLIICAGVAWYLTNAAGHPAEDAVLAKRNVTEKEIGTVRRRCDSGEIMSEAVKECGWNGK